LSKVCSNCYGKIYTQPRDTKEIKENRRRALNGLGNRVTQEMNTILGDELIKRELHAVAKLMSKARISHQGHMV
jgi:hypothetical protein